MGVIYCYTNLINGKKYFGQTVSEKTRYILHKSNAFNENSPEYNSVFHRAIRKYGWDNFKYEIVATSDDIEILNSLEIMYIKKYNTKVPNGYNVEDGGRNSAKPKSEETKIKLSQSKAVLSEEEIIAIRIAYKNNESPSKYFKEHYEGQMHYNSFLNIWTGQKYKYIMPEVIENGRHRKLNLELAREIRKEYAAGGVSYDKLAEKYKVGKCTIRDIIKNKTWKE